MHDVTIHNVSPELFERVKDAVLGKFSGKALSNDNEVDVQGIRSRYTYDAKAQSLTVTLISTPAVITKGYALGQLYDVFGLLAVKGPVKT